jgi:hypothetical protein
VLSVSLLLAISLFGDVFEDDNFRTFYLVGHFPFYSGTLHVGFTHLNLRSINCEQDFLKLDLASDLHRQAIDIDSLAFSGDVLLSPRTNHCVLHFQFSSFSLPICLRIENTPPGVGKVGDTYARPSSEALGQATGL